MGILLIISGFVYDVFFAGIPYQDPTPAMIQQYNFHRSIANITELIGLIVIIVSIIGNICKKLFKNKTL